MARPRKNAVEDLQAREVPISILQWAGMNSEDPASSILINEFAVAQNMDYVSDRIIRSRMGSTEHMGNAVTSSSRALLGPIVFRPNGGAPLIYFATDLGKYYSVDAVSGGTPTLIGDITTGVPLRRVKAAVFKNRIWIADGYKAWVYDPTATPTLAEVVLPFEVSAKVVDVRVLYSRVWWVSDEDDFIASAPNDPTSYDVVDDAWQATISEDDGQSNWSMVAWGKTFALTKQDPEIRMASMYKLSGYDISTFRVDDMFGDISNPTGFMGDSAVAIGNDVLGLTYDGFTTLSAVNNFNEASINTLSQKVDNFVRRINWDAQHHITAIYDMQTRQYLCAVPIDASPVNNFIFVFSPKYQTWSYYDNWDVRNFFNVKNVVHFTTNDGRIVKTRSSQADEGSGFTKRLLGANWHFDSPDALKYFKALEVEMKLYGAYSVTATPYLDGTRYTAGAVNITGTAGNAWDDFTWDVDNWDNDPNVLRNIRLLHRCKALQIEYINSNANEPFAIKTATVRSFVTDSGDPRVH